MLDSLENWENQHQKAHLELEKQTVSRLEGIHYRWLAKITSSKTCSSAWGQTHQNFRVELKNADGLG